MVRLHTFLVPVACTVALLHSSDAHLRQIGKDGSDGEGRQLHGTLSGKALKFMNYRQDGGDDRRLHATFSGQGMKFMNYRQEGNLRAKRREH